jgi:hypothetical protein
VAVTFILTKRILDNDTIAERPTSAKAAALYFENNSIEFSLLFLAETCASCPGLSANLTVVGVPASY